LRRAGMVRWTEEMRLLSNMLRMSSLEMGSVLHVMSLHSAVASRSDGLIGFFLDTEAIPTVNARRQGFHCASRCYS
jgi:hypothetical protein